MTEEKRLTSSEIAGLLVGAAERLEPVDVLKDPAPQINLAFAFDQALTVWKVTSGLLKPEARRSLRIAALGVKAVREQLEANARLRNRDNDTIHNAAKSFREVAASIPVRRVPVEPTVQYSSLGMRMHSLAELAGAVPFVVLESKVSPPPQPLVAAVPEDPTDEYMKQVHALAIKSKTDLPRVVPKNQSWVLVRMPLIISTKKPISDMELKRANIKGRQLKSPGAAKEHNVMHSKTKMESSNLILIEDQLVVGMRKEDVADHKRAASEKRIGGNIPSGHLENQKFKTLDQQVIYTNKKAKMPDIIPGAANRATEFMSDQLGTHVNGMGAMQPPFFGAQNNPLVWMWLVPEHTIATLHGFVVTGVAFPTISEENPELRDARVGKLQQDLKQLQEMQEILHSRGQELNEETLTRMNKLMHELHVDSKVPRAPTQAEKDDRLAAQKMEADALIAKTYAKTIARIAELREKLKEDKDNKTLKLELKVQNSILEAGERKIKTNLLKQAHKK